MGVNYTRNEGVNLDGISTQIKYDEYISNVKAEFLERYKTHCLGVNENFTGTSCQQLEDSGIASHEYCYLKHGYCELGVNDLIKVMWIAKSEILNAQMWRMFIHVHRQCKNTL